MAGIKFYVHGGGTWREVNTNSGRVTGWGKIQFLYVRRGRLVVAHRNSVLKGLRALVAGQPTTVRDGPQLPQIRRIKQSKRSNKAKRNLEDEQKLLHKYGHCCPFQHNCISHQHPSISDTLFNSLLKVNTNTTATQCDVFVDNSAQTGYNSDTDKCTELEQTKPKVSSANKIKPINELTIDEEDIFVVRSYLEKNEKNVFNVSLIDFDADDSCKRSLFYKINPLVLVSRSQRIAEMIRPQSQCSSVTLKDFIANLGLQSIEEVRKKSKYKMRVRRTPVSQDNAKSNESDADKENQLNSKKRNLSSNRSKTNQSYLQLRRSNRKSINNTELNKDNRGNSSDGKNFVSKSAQTKVLNHEKNVRRDVSSSKNKLFEDKSHKLHPQKDDAGVKSKRERIERNDNTTVSSKKENKLSQEKIERYLKKRRAENNKTFNNRPRVKPLPNANIQQSEANRSGDKERPNLITKRVSSRPYSRLEDEAIVSWLKSDDRAHLVNGNRVWKELQPRHQTATGHFRPWQSLRNRYLRYILPALGQLAVPPALAQRLRAAAAEGELKSKTTPARSNSIFKDKRVRSAWALRPRTPVRTPPSPPLAAVPPTSLVSPTPPASSSAGTSFRSRTRTTNGAMNTSQPLTKRRDSTSSCTSGSSSAAPKRSLRSSAVRSPTLPTPNKRIKRKSSLTYSELTRRFVSRHKSTPQSENSSPDSRREKQLRSVITQSDTSVDQREGNAKRRRSQQSDRDAKRRRSQQSDGDAKRRRSQQSDRDAKRRLSQQSDSSTSSSSSSSLFESDHRRSTRLLNRTTERPRTRRLYNPRAV